MTRDTARRRAGHLRHLVLIVAIGTSACVNELVPVYDSSQAELPLRAMLAAGEYKGRGYTKVNASPFASALGAELLIDEYVSDEAAAAFEAVSPDESNGGPPFPVGGVIVREVADSTGVVKKLTIMKRLPADFYAACGDFFFGVTSPDGVPLTDAQGLLWGRLDSCAGCHIPRASAGFLFGVAKDNRAGSHVAF